MKGIILVGGEGTRLRPLTYTRPKAMVPILGRPFLEHMLVHLRRHGVADVSLALGHQPGPILAYFGDGSRWGIRLTTVVEEQPLGSGGAIKQFEALLTEPFFAFNGDVLTDCDLVAMREAHERAGAALTMLLIHVEDPSSFGVATLDEHQRIRGFVEKPAREQAPSHWANAGIWLFRPDVLQRIPAGRRSMVEIELFPELIDSGESVHGYCERGFWVDIGVPERYLAAQLELLEQPRLRLLPLGTWPGTPFLSADERPAAGRSPSVDAGAILTGPVLLGDDVRIESGARITGPAVIGAGSHIGRGCCIERSVLWESCRLEHGSEVGESVLADGVQLAPSALLRRVIAGSAARFAAGCKVADQRVDPATIHTE